MNKTFTKDLAAWIGELKKAAANDEPLAVSWFSGTKDSKIAIVGGWENGFNSEDADLFCISKSNPTYAMCIKIAINNGPYASVDYEQLDMPTAANGEVDDTSLTLEWEDNPEALAAFYADEWERISNTYERRLC